MTDDYMQQIVNQTKNYEFRRYRIDPSVLRVWFYLNAPHSHIAYICEIDPARTRNPGDEPLIEDGLGNKEFNERHKDWAGYDYAYRIRSVWKLNTPIGLDRMKTMFGMKGPPRGLVYTPATILGQVRWNEQEMIWSIGSDVILKENMPSGMMGIAKRSRESIDEENDMLMGKRCATFFSSQTVIF
jgi:predicted transcriptional regulator